MDPLQTVAAVCSGVIVGFVLGPDGGGSILAVALLLYVVGMRDPPLAIGTSAVAVAVSAFANLVRHGRERHVRRHAALIFAAAGLAGAFASSSIGKAVDGRRLLILSALLTLFVAAMMLRGRKAGPGPAGAERPVSGSVGSSSGLARFSGFYDIGGGFLVVPAQDRHADDRGDWGRAGRVRATCLSEPEVTALTVSRADALAALSSGMRSPKGRAGRSIGQQAASQPH